ncbi:MAG: ABC transporter ATP-binding protein [Clostridia bacterium]|nr:ABC transporter ATP-binding protein [Clostridia bacterium]
MKKVLSYLRDYRKESILGPLFKLLEACFELIVPFVIAAIVDKGIPGGDAGYILRMGAVLVLLGLIGLASSVTAQYFAAKAAVGLATKLRHAVFAHIQRLGFADLDRIGTSTLITRMTSDINQVQSGVNLALRLFLRSPFIVFGAMIMAFTIDVCCALVFAVAIPVLAVIVFGIMLITMPLYKRTQAQLDGVLLLTRENLSGTRVLRAFGREDDEIAEFDRQHAGLTRLQSLSGKISSLMNPLTYIAINFALIVLLNTGAVRVNAGALTQGQIVALVNYIGQILVELIKLANLIITVSKAAACANRVSAVLSVRPGMASPRDAETPEAADLGSVEFDHVSLRYAEGASDALTDIHFSARRGQMIGVIGGTGSGKSSLVNLIPRFYDATQGCVRVDGLDVRRYRLEELRGRIGVVPQKALLFKGSIRENLLWGNPNADDDTILEAVRAAQAEDVLAAKGGLDGMLEQNGRNLSGGQRQRLTIARALVRRPEILILDDSASALDFATDARLRMAIRKLPYHPTVFIVSQRSNSVRYADSIVVLDDGQVAGIGSHDELLRTCGVYREIYESQFRKEVQ